MANERIVSPGVFTRERDLSFLTQGISEIGGAFIGPTPKGPAFIPTIVRSQQEYVTLFGEADANHYTGLTVKNYLRESGVATIVRVLGTEGYNNDTTVPGLIYVSGSSGKKLFAVVHPSSVGNTIESIAVAGNGGSFSVNIVADGGTAVSQSGLTTLETSTAYFGDLLGTSPVTTKNSFVYAIFPESVTAATAGGQTVSVTPVASQSLGAGDVPVGVATGSLTKYVVPVASLTNIDTTKLSQATVSGSGINFGTLLLPEYTAISSTNVVFIVSSSNSGTLNTVTYQLTSAGQTAAVTMHAETSSAALNFTDVGFSNAHTPTIQSQTIAGAKINLFTLHTLSDGNFANKEIKVSFLNMKKSDDVDNPWGTFSMLIRRYDDTDARIEVLEQYDNLTLDPDSPQFIARVIGDSAPYDDPNTAERYYQGDFPNRSQYVYVQMSGDVIPATALPFGFGPIESTVSGSVSVLTSPSLVTSRWRNGSVQGYTTESVDKRFYYGWNFADNEGTNPSYLGPIPNPENPVDVPDSSFTLETLYEVPSGSSLQFSASISLDNDSLAYRKFSVPFQGGFDGLNPARDIKMGGDIVATNSQGFNLANAASPGSKAYKKALQALSNQDQWDFNLLILPGVIYDFHSYVADTALSLCEDRGDCFYIMDTTGLNATIASATAKAGEIDSNYAATYYPWLRVIDTNTNKLIWVPPSVILPEIYAYNDNIAAEWFAPAGLNRGGIASAVGVKVRLPQTSRDTLYEGKVNPIAQFPGQGICVWGQKTLQRRASALDRVNVRRLLIAVKKYIASVSRYLVFEQNVEATRNRFLNIVNPYLASVQERSGLYAFRVIMDETNNTPDIIDRNILYGQLYLQPTRTAEFIILDFNVLPTGATFPTA
jgi:hypothetical protein